MADDPRFHLETAANVLTSGGDQFENLVRARDGEEFLNQLYALRPEALREVVFERVVAERARRLGHDSAT